MPSHFCEINFSKKTTFSKYQNISFLEADGGLTVGPINSNKPLKGALMSQKCIGKVFLPKCDARFMPFRPYIQSIVSSEI